MRILTFKRVLVLAGLGYGYQYAKKHGGVRNAWNELVGKAKLAIDRGRESFREAAHDTTGMRSGMAGTAGDIGDDARSTTGYSSGYTPGGSYSGGGGSNRGL
jgi:hypothetical protein